MANIFQWGKPVCPACGSEAWTNVHFHPDRKQPEVLFRCWNRKCQNITGAPLREALVQQEQGTTIQDFINQLHAEAQGGKPPCPGNPTGTSKP